MIRGGRQFVLLWLHTLFPLWMSHDVLVSVDGLIVSEHFAVKNDATVWLMKLYAKR
jgi:hypothetical protein